MALGLEPGADASVDATTSRKEKPSTWGCRKFSISLRPS
jgi:hypothetical protein